MWTATLQCIVLWLSVQRVRVQAPQATSAADWWRDAIYYRILVDSFKDSNGDGLGDLQGITNNMGYIRSLGSQAMVISPLMAKSRDCTKPGILALDPTQLDERFGTDQHFTALLDKADKLEMKVLNTLPLETISELSEWAVLSANRSAGYEDYLVWHESSLDTPPPTIEKKGVSVLWRWHPVRGAYFATDVSGEALLNSCSSGLRAAAATVLVSWLRRGAAGLLIQADFPLQPDCGRALVKHLARAAADYSRMRSSALPVLMVETKLSWRQAVQYYADKVNGLGVEGAHLVLYRDLAAEDGDDVPRTAPDFKLVIDKWMTFIPPDMPPLWMNGSPFLSRISSVYGSGMVDAFNIITLLLPGSGIFYQGNELGMPDAVLERAEINSECTPTQPHPGNAPFAWDDSVESAGFSEGKPWLPLADNHRYCNAKTQFASNTSHAAVFRATAMLKRTAVAGAHAEVRRLGNNALGVLRWGTIAGSVLAIANVGATPGDATLSRFPGVPNEYTVATSSVGSSLSAGEKVSSTRPLRLAAGEAAVLIGGPRHCGGPGPVEKIASKLSEAAQKINKYFNF